MATSNRKSSNNPCWDGYEKIGMKMKGGKSVPDCVPIKKAGKKAATKKVAAKKSAAKKSPKKSATKKAAPTKTAKKAATAKGK